MIRRTVLGACAALAVFGATNASAQTIGFKIGASFSNWSVKEDNTHINTNSITGLMGGGFIRFGTGQIALQPELMVVTRGTEFQAEAGDPFGVGRFKLDYVEVPVLLHLALNSGMGISPYIIAGPSFAFEIGCKVEYEGNNVSGSVDCDSNGDVFTRKKLDIGLTGGAGLAFPVGPGSLLIEGRYNYGLSNIYDGSSVEIKSRTPAVLAGYSIPLSAR